MKEICINEKIRQDSFLILQVVKRECQKEQIIDVEEYMTEQKLTCNIVPSQHCSTKYNKQCQYEERQVCKTVYKKQCTNEQKEKCTTEYTQVSIT
jgi:hypothetical protein